MKRILSLITAGLVMLVLSSSASAGLVPHAGTCGNGFPNDGHSGPWWVSNPGGIQGNTVSVDCPTSSTHWDLNYKIQFLNNTGGWTTWFNQHRSGNGSPSDFAYLVQTTCDSGLHQWRTHVDNNITGGNINKPAGGAGVFLAC